MTLPLKHIIKVMNDIHPMPQGLQLKLYDVTERLEVPKHQVLLQPGQMCNYLYYIEKGVVSCYETEEGKKIYTWLMQEGDIATSVESFNLRVPAKDTIETLTDCIMHTLSWQWLTDLTRSHWQFGAIRQHLTDLYHLQSRTVDAKSKRDPEQFYQYLKSLYRKNLDLIPDKILASYMGISLPTLYRHKK
jgi:CRP-like cAMP-binding protein